MNEIKKENKGFWGWLFSNIIFFLTFIVEDCRPPTYFAIYLFGSAVVLWFFSEIVFDVYFMKTIWFFPLTVGWFISSLFVFMYAIYREEP